MDSGKPIYVTAPDMRLTIDIAMKLAVTRTTLILNLCTEGTINKYGRVSRVKFRPEVALEDVILIDDSLRDWYVNLAIGPVITIPLDCQLTCFALEEGKDPVVAAIIDKDKTVLAVFDFLHIASVSMSLDSVVVEMPVDITPVSCVGEPLREFKVTETNDVYRIAATVVWDACNISVDSDMRYWLNSVLNSHCTYIAVDPTPSMTPELLNAGLKISNHEVIGLDSYVVYPCNGINVDHIIRKSVNDKWIVPVIVDGKTHLVESYRQPVTLTHTSNGSYQMIGYPNNAIVSRMAGLMSSAAYARLPVDYPPIEMLNKVLHVAVNKPFTLPKYLKHPAKPLRAISVPKLVN